MLKLWRRLRGRLARRTVRRLLRSRFWYQDWYPWGVYRQRFNRVTGARAKASYRLHENGPLVGCRPGARSRAFFVNRQSEEIARVNLLLAPPPTP